ncbi:MAG: hypothetical protein KBT39_09660 [Bacteroidales bacterium]|nr:hypothetical protein [Bacteroidales bacterium]
MVISFDVKTDTNDVFRVSLSSGEDAFFATENVMQETALDVEIIEIDLERIEGHHNADIRTLRIIADGIGRCFSQNSKAILYYYCDEIELPIISQHHSEKWPQEYRSQLFSRMFQRYASKAGDLDIIDMTVEIIQGDRPIFMHLIARECHRSCLETLKNYITTNYGK